MFQINIKFPFLLNKSYLATLGSHSCRAQGAGPLHRACTVRFATVPTRPDSLSIGPAEPCGHLSWQWLRVHVTSLRRVSLGLQRRWLEKAVLTVSGPGLRRVGTVGLGLPPRPVTAALCLWSPQELPEPRGQVLWSRKQAWRGEGGYCAQGHTSDKRLSQDSNQAFPSSWHWPPA